MTHYLKISSKYYRRLVEGIKTFEVRLNDRDYQIGDKICFHVNTSGVNYMDGIMDPACEWRIQYVHAGLGMADGFVVLGIRPIVKVQNSDAV